MIFPSLEYVYNEVDKLLRKYNIDTYGIYRSIKIQHQDTRNKQYNMNINTYISLYDDYNSKNKYVKDFINNYKKKDTYDSVILVSEYTDFDSRMIENMTIYEMINKHILKVERQILDNLKIKYINNKIIIKDRLCLL